MIILNSARKRLLTTAACSAALSFASVGMACAQVAEPTTVDEVVVTGVRPIAESEAAALRVQRESDSLVSVVAADSIGRFPDQNIAFAVGRLPGVAVQRDQGQARYVNLRGAPLNWTTLSFDGLSVVSPEGRASRFDNIPSAIASQVVVSKAITPDMPGDTVAGNVNIITRSAFDYPGFHVAGNLAAGYVALGGGTEADSSLVVSNRFMDDKLGVLLQASYYTRDMVTDNFETDYEVAPEDRRPGFENRKWARETENKLYRLTRENTSYSGRLDYRFDDANQISLSSIFVQYEDTELRSNYIFDFDGNSTNFTGACPAVRAPQTNIGYADICNGNTPEFGTTFGTVINANFNSLATQEYISTTTLSGEHDDLGGWDLSWRLNYTLAHDGRDAPGLSNFTTSNTRTLRPTVEYDFRNEVLHRVRLFNTVATGTGAATVFSRGTQQFAIEQFPLVLTGNGFQTREGQDETDSYTAKFDLDREFTVFNSPFRFETGGFFSTRTKESNETVFRATPAQITAAGRALPTFADLAIVKPFLGNIPLGYSFQYFSKPGLENIVADLVRAGVATSIDTSANYFSVTEDIFAGYLKGTLEHDWGNIVFGARVEYTENSGEAFVTIPGQPRGLVEVTNDETLVFPSAHLNWDLTEDVKVRFGVTTGASRPDYDDLRPNFVIDDVNMAISGGNPLAGPEKAVGADAYLEWYIPTGGFFSVGAYYKDLTDVLFGSQRTFGLDTLDTPGTDRSGYTLRTLVNGGSGYIAGFEVAYAQSAELLVERLNLPQWMAGFGIQTNLTLNESEAETPAITGGAPSRTVRLPGTSDIVGNASIYYENDGLSVRLAYQFRSDWADGIGEYQFFNGQLRATGNGDVFWSDDEELDFSARFRVNDNFELYFDAVNLLDGPGERFSENEFNVIEQEKFGERYILGLRFNY